VTERGTLYLVVGPSGAGKDTLIAGAKERLRHLDNWVFPARVIDRPVVPDAEVHEPVTRAEFDRRRATGELFLVWEAHGSRYGLPRSMEDDLAQGRNVVVNVSRAVVARARQRFQPCRVIVVTAPAAILAARLAQRGRETGGEIRERLERRGEPLADGPDVRVVINDGSVADGVHRFLTALEAE